MRKFCAVMDLPPPFSEKLYNKSVKKIHKAVTIQAQCSMLDALREESELEQSTDLKISGDGTWQKRGFSSKNGIVSAIAIQSGKVVDCEIRTTVCRRCFSYKGLKSGEEFEAWRNEHKEECSINHEGSSGMMEVNGMIRIFKRSEDQGIRYSHYIGDGDSKTFYSIVKEKPYGDDLIPIKVECVRQVQKRMGTRLRNLKKEYKAKKLKDGKTLGGGKRLTDKKIDIISSHYGNAIRKSKTVEGMKDNIWAIFYHYKSTDQKPQHHLCPKGQDSWCPYNKAVHDGEQQKFKHKSSLPAAVMDVIEPVFKDLSKNELLERCVGGLTQNPNESLNSVIWKNVSKNIFCGRKVLEIGVLSAVLVFNNGMRSLLDVMKEFGIEPGKFFVDYVNKVDNRRVTKADIKAWGSTKEARKAKRRKEKAASENLISEEGSVYGPGQF